MGAAIPKPEKVKTLNPDTATTLEERKRLSAEGQQRDLASMSGMRGTRSLFTSGYTGFAPGGVSMGKGAAMTPQAASG